MRIRKYYFFAVALLAASCGGQQSANDLFDSLDGRDLSAYEELVAEAEDAVRYYSMDPSQEHYMQMMEAYQSLESTPNLDDYEGEEKKNARKIRYAMDSLHAAMGSRLEAGLTSLRYNLFEGDDQLVEDRLTTPVYLKRGSRLFLDMETSGTITVKFYNADSRATLKTYTGKKQIHDSVNINNSAIYLIEIIPKGVQYINYKITRSVADIEDLNSNPKISIDTVECSAGDFLAHKVNGIKMTNIFEEPRKITLRSQGKAFFSGSSRSVVAVQIPKGASDLFYSLRISTNEGDRSDDGKFCDNMSSTYKRVKFLGLPVYESAGNRSSLIRELLNNNMPPREEEAYCNMYVVKESAQAKKFQDGTPAADIRYDINRSLIGTQSCNGCLDVKGMSTIYLCFENERFRYSNYLWLEVVTAIPHTEYFNEKYSLK